MQHITITRSHPIEDRPTRALPRPSLLRRIRLAFAKWIRRERENLQLKRLTKRQWITIQKQIAAMDRMAASNLSLRKENEHLRRSRGQLLSHRELRLSK